MRTRSKKNAKSVAHQNVRAVDVLLPETKIPETARALSVAVAVVLATMKMRIRGNLDHQEHAAVLARNHDRSLRNSMESQRGKKPSVIWLSSHQQRTTTNAVAAEVADAVVVAAEAAVVLVLAAGHAQVVAKVEEVAVAEAAADVVAAMAAILAVAASPAIL